MCYYHWYNTRVTLIVVSTIFIQEVKSMFLWNCSLFLMNQEFRMKNIHNWTNFFLVISTKQRFIQQFQESGFQWIKSILRRINVIAQSWILFKPGDAVNMRAFYQQCMPTDFTTEIHLMAPSHGLMYQMNEPSVFTWSQVNHIKIA
jgi:hypothetical protein